MRKYLRKHWFWLGVNIVAAIPLLWLLWDMAAGNLSVNPIADITTRTGKNALILLMLSLACTPANIVTGWRQPIQVRKALGLWAFVYASFHLLNFVGNDYLFDLHYILLDGVATKPFILVGFTAFLLLVPLAITSTRGWMKRLGSRWTTLHKLVYIAGPLVIIHFLWLAKAARDWEPLTYGAILAILLLVRVPSIRRRIIETRRRLTGPPPATKRSGQVHVATRARPAGSPVAEAPPSTITPL